MLGCPLRRDQNNFFKIILQFNCFVIPFKFALLLCFCLYLQKNISGLIYPRLISLASSPVSCSDTASSLVSASMSQDPCGGGCPMCYNSLASPCAECDCHSLRLSAIPILSLSNVSLQDKYFFMFINIFLGSTPSTGWCSGAAPRVPGPDPRSALKSNRSGLPDSERMSEASCYYGLGQITSRIATAIFDTNRNVSCYTVNIR